MLKETNTILTVAFLFYPKIVCSGTSFSSQHVPANVSWLIRKTENKANTKRIPVQQVVGSFKSRQGHLSETRAFSENVNLLFYLLPMQCIVLVCT